MCASTSGAARAKGSGRAAPASIQRRRGRASWGGVMPVDIAAARHWPALPGAATAQRARMTIMGEGRRAPFAQLRLAATLGRRLCSIRAVRAQPRPNSLLRTRTKPGGTDSQIWCAHSMECRPTDWRGIIVADADGQLLVLRAARLPFHRYLVPSSDRRRLAIGLSTRGARLAQHARGPRHVRSPASARWPSAGNRSAAMGRTRPQGGGL